MIGFDLDMIRAYVDMHGKVARILVAAHKGSTPRETGTSMLVWQNGQSGTIGGGALELDAIESARSYLESGTNSAMKHVPLGPALGQCCGGAVKLVFEVFDKSTLPISDTVFTRNINGDDEAPLAVVRAIAGARRGEVVASHLTQGWMIEQMSPALTPLWIYGAGHVGQALVETLMGLPFAITWVDTNENRFTDIPEGVTKFVASQPANVVKHAPSDAHHLVLTYSHALDLELCHAVLSHEFASLGLIGSKTKRTRFQKRLAALGHSDMRIAQMTCPIGNPDLGKLPKAIALGVVSELLTFQAVQTDQKKAII
jgi:xanthine dehydrogenase accessory factor